MKLDPETMPHCFIVNTSNKVLMIKKCGKVSDFGSECVLKVENKASPTLILVIIF